MKRSFFILSLLLLGSLALVGTAAGSTENFQNGPGDFYGAGINGPNLYPNTAITPIAYPYFDTFGTDRECYNTVAQPANYLSFVSVPKIVSPTNSMLSFALEGFDASGQNGVQAGFGVNAGQSAENPYCPVLVEVIRVDNTYQYYVNGVYISSGGVVNSVPYLYWVGTGVGVRDDFVIGASGNKDIVGTIPSTWSVIKDMNDPTLSGLYDGAGNQVYSTIMHASYSGREDLTGATISIDGDHQVQSIVPTNTKVYVNGAYVDAPTRAGIVTFDLTEFMAAKSYGRHTIQLTTSAGTTSSEFWYEGAATVGTSIAFDRDIYANADSVGITSTVGTSYWLPGSYSYYGVLYDTTTGQFKGTNWSIGTQTSTHTASVSSDLFPASGDYATMLYAVDSQGNHIMLASDTTHAYVDSVVFSGTVYDAQQGTVMSGATVSLTQGGSTTTKTTGSDGRFEFLSLQKDVLTSISTAKSGYTTALSSTTPTDYKRYELQTALSPSTPTHTATTVFGTVKCYPMGSFVASPAVRILKDGVLVGSTTATEKGFYIFDNLEASTTYTVEVEKAGYLDYSNAVVTGTANSLTEMDPMMVPTYSITVVLKDSLTQQTITGLMAVSLGDGQSVQTSTGSATFTAVGMGTNSIAVVGSGYTAQSSTQSITGDQTITLYITPAAVVPTTAVAFTTTPTPAIVNMGGTVYDGMTGGTISGATVNVTVIQDSISRFDIADSSGVYSVPNIQNNVLVTVNATAAGYTHTAFTFTPVGSTEYLVDLYMYRIDESTNPTHDPVVGQAGAGGMVLGGPYHELVESPTVTASNGTWSGTATIDSGHSWYFTNLEPNSEYNFTVSAAGFVTRTVPATTGAGDSFTVVPVILDGVYDITIQIKEVESSSLILQPVQVTCSNGVTQNTSTGSTTFTNLEYATFVFTATCEGYQQGGTSVLAYASHTESLYMTKIPTSADNQIQYSIPPKNVELVARNMMGVALSGVTVSAQGQSTTLPDTSMLGAIFGWTEKYSDVNLANATMTGVTGSDGAISFLMADSVNYQIKFTDPARGIDETVELMPHDSQYLFFLGSNPGQTPVAGMPNMTVWATDVNSSTPVLHGHYFDQVGHTTSVTFIVETQNGTPVHNQTWAGQQTVDTTYTVPHVKGAMYVYGFRASTTDRGELEKWDGITLHSRLVDLGIEDGYYFWISLCFLIPFAGIFSGMTVKYGFILLPLFAGLLFYIGWLEISATILTIAIVLGVLMYITKVQVS